MQTGLLLLLDLCFHPEVVQAQLRACCLSVLQSPRHASKITFNGCSVIQSALRRGLQILWRCSGASHGPSSSPYLYTRICDSALTLSTPDASSQLIATHCDRRLCNIFGFR